jgi:hypothetical protein
MRTSCAFEQVIGAIKNAYIFVIYLMANRSGTFFVDKFERNAFK